MKKLIITYFVLAIFLLSSCLKKDTSVFVPDPGQQLDSAWTNTPAATSQVFLLGKNLQGPIAVQEMNTATDSTVLTSNGLQFYFPKNGLLVNGVTLTAGLKIETVLLLKKGDFIRYGVPSSASRYPLESGGSLLVKLSAGGQPVTLAAGKKYAVRYKDAEAKPLMSVFYGNGTPVTSSLGFDWALAADNSTVKPWDSLNANPVTRGYILETFRTGWVGVGKSIETTLPRVEVAAVLPDLFSNANTVVFMVFRNLRSVVQLSGNPSTRRFSFPNIPVNQGVIFIAISKVGDSYYLGIKEENTTPNLVSFVKPQLSSLDAINAFLNSL